MALTDAKDVSKGFVKRVASSFTMRKKKHTSTGTGVAPPPPKGLPRSKSTGSTNYESMRLPAKKIQDLTNKTRIIKSAGVMSQPRREKIDDRNRNTKTFGKWRSFDDSDSIWLSSDCTSPTSLLEERRLSVTFRFSVDESVVSWLSNLANSSLNLNQEATSIKDRKRLPKNTKENAEINQKQPGKVYNKNSSVKSSETSSSSISMVSATKSTTTSDSSTQNSQGKKVSFSRSSSTQHGSENSQALTPTSSLTSDPSPQKVSALVHLNEDTEILQNSKNTKNVLEPLFWPYEQRFDWTPEDILKHFSMSPRRKKSLNSKVSSGTSPRSMRAQLQTRKLDLKEGSKRKLIFNNQTSNTTSSQIPEFKRTISNNSKDNNKKITKIMKNEPIRNIVKRNKSLPSRLRKSSKTSSKVVPIEVAEVAAENKAKEEEIITATKMITRKSKTMLEDDFAFMNDFSIENAVGLGEFKGREGLDSEFNNSDIFLFHDSL